MSYSKLEQIKLSLQEMFWETKDSPGGEHDLIVLFCEEAFRLVNKLEDDLEEFAQSEEYAEYGY